MNSEISPAIERSAIAARTLAESRGEHQPRLSDWFRCLLADDEGRPWLMLERLTIDPQQCLTTLDRMPASDVPVAPPEHELYRTARKFSIRLRGDPDLTTDFILLAIAAHDPIFTLPFEPLGLTLSRLEASLLSPLMATPTSEPASEPEPELSLSVPARTPRPQPPNVPPHSSKESIATGPMELTEAARIIDANFNRAREALRVLDDYARFGRNDPLLTEQLKQLRHRLVETFERFPAVNLLRSRDTVGDVGVTVTATGEYQRSTPRQVALVNFKRLQESLRSLEEFSKLWGQQFPRSIEQLRYETYTLERMMFGQAPLHDRLARTKLYALLTGTHCVRGLEWTIAEAAAGGVDVIQLREKSLSDRELLQRARDVRQWTRAAGVLLILNDRPDLARLAEADGVHLGQDDLSVAEARRLLPPEMLIGVSTHNREQLQQAIRDGADYLGVGPTFPSTTKTFQAFPGLDFVREVFSTTGLPAFALGGITPETLPEVLAAGATRIAVSAAISQATEPREAARKLKSLIEAKQNTPPKYAT